MESQRVSFKKAQGAVIKYLKSLPTHMNQNNVKVILRKQFPLVLAATQASQGKYIDTNRKEKVNRSLISNLGSSFKLSQIMNLKT